MSDTHKGTWIKGLIAVGLLAIGGLSYYSWHLHHEVQALQQDQYDPLAMNQPFLQPDFDPLSKQNPQDLFDAMRKQMNKVMNDFSAQSVFTNQDSALFSAQQPNIELKDEKNAYKILVDIPKGANVNLSTKLDNHEFTIDGSVKYDVKNEHQQFSSVNQFSRTFYLADAVKQGDMQTTQSDDEIVITVPKVS